MFCESLLKRKEKGFVPVIPDIKIISPKEGNLLSGRDPVCMAKLFEKLGAPALSVVTEKERFGGSVELLESIVKAVSVPVLRKDFITCEAEIYKTKKAGASAVLLICACMDEKTLFSLYNTAVKISLEPLVEAHTKEELEIASKLGARLVGINNRDILMLEKDNGNISRTKAISRYAPKGALLISESGIETPLDVEEAVNSGADAVLVGTALWKAEDTASFYMKMSEAHSGEAEK